MKPCLLLQICQMSIRNLSRAFIAITRKARFPGVFFTVFYFNDHSGTKDYPMNSYNSYKTDHGFQNSKHTKNQPCCDGQVLRGPKGWFLLKTTIFLRILFHTHRVRITLKTTEIKSSANLPETATKKAKHTNGATNRLIFEAVSPPAKRTFSPRRLTDDQRRTALKNRLDSIFI